jgi:hypothetical protein
VRTALLPALLGAADDRAPHSELKPALPLEAVLGLADRGARCKIQSVQVGLAANKTYTQALWRLQCRNIRKHVAIA